ncbi:MAG TPA: 1-acyl-sn-glycerol-3-phosphate acyltransferase [Nocardioidaceae bacterium]|nr:1-acyl-sn-glycerol-3-phosphate acyltransferase [Nocardioidaceae bacterium]
MSGRAEASFLSAIASYLRAYHRHEVVVDAMPLTQPALFVANHGFGGVVDLNALALRTALDQFRGERHVTYLVHQLAWTVGLGGVVEALGGRQGSVESLQEAFAAGNHVAVFPGGDIDASKATKHRNRITFSGRSGFARMAIEHGVDVVPVVTAGAGESLYVLTDGQRLAKALRLPELLRVKALPVSLSFPWGLSVGVAGMLPYAPLPTKLVTAVLPPMRAHDGESAADFAERVEAAMQARLDQLTENRLPILG